MTVECNNVNSVQVKKRKRPERYPKAVSPVMNSSLLLLVEAADAIRQGDCLSTPKTVSPLLKPIFPTVVPHSPVTVIGRFKNERTEANPPNHTNCKKRKLESKFSLQAQLYHIHYGNKRSFNESATIRFQQTPSMIPMHIGKPLFAPPKLLSGMEPGEIRRH
ncbi:hypothetical protein IV203_033125 [Nitzschia inconspicua]|uniref:Uncharacterized protein n=1 Tax=Nitzschia inconspicua TaxID=303405 RepID=A0A9K3KM08_9STRA|nr:hypothetical protein IV203_033125 [Nitzschia inconspicua]